MITIIPSILTDSARVFSERFRMMHPITSKIHIDVMDGVLVASRSLEIETIVAILQKEIYTCAIELHLMVADPLSILTYIKQIPHLSGVILYKGLDPLLPEIVQAFQSEQISVGVYFDDKSMSPLFAPAIEPDFFLLLTETSPGFSGTPFNHEILSIISQLKAQYPEKEIEVDGGLNEETIPICIEKGVYSFVVNSTIFHSEDPVQKFYKLMNIHL